MPSSAERPTPQAVLAMATLTTMLGRFGGGVLPPASLDVVADALARRPGGDPADPAGSRRTSRHLAYRLPCGHPLRHPPRRSCLGDVGVEEELSRTSLGQVAGRLGRHHGQSDRRAATGGELRRAAIGDGDRAGDEAVEQRGAGPAILTPGETAAMNQGWSRSSTISPAAVRRLPDRPSPPPERLAVAVVHLEPVAALR